MGVLILGVNTLYGLFFFFKLFPMVGKGLSSVFSFFALLIFVSTGWLSVAVNTS